MSLIDDVSEKIRTQFERLWPYQGQGGALSANPEICPRDVVAAEHQRAADLAACSDYVPDGLLYVLDLPAEEFVSAVPLDQRARYWEPRRSYLADKAGYLAERAEKKAKHDAALAQAREFQAGQEAQQVVFREVRDEVSDQFNRLTPSTFPRDDETVADQMYRFLTAFSKAYALKGKQSSAYRLIEYLLKLDYDHWAWLWREWIASCLAVGDRSSAESLIAAVTDGDTPAAHEFAKKGGRFKAHVMVAKAMIALRCDGDLQLAHKIATNARDNFGDVTDAVKCYRAISYVRQEVEAGRIEMRMNLGPNGDFIGLEAINRAVPAAALLTGNWGLGDPGGTPQIEHEAAVDVGGAS